MVDPHGKAAEAEAVARARAANPGHEAAAISAYLKDAGAKFGAALAQMVIGREELVIADPDAVAAIIARAIARFKRRYSDGGVAAADLVEWERAARAALAAAFVARAGHDQSKEKSGA